MKKQLFFMLVTASIALSSVVDEGAFDKKFNMLSQKRIGLSEESINNMKDPFPAPSIASTILGEKYDLTGIFGDRAKINNKWYKINEYVGIYKVKSINDKSVLLENDTQKRELKLNEGRKNVTITYN